jgi:hypothetical protein
MRHTIRPQWIYVKKIDTQGRQEQKLFERSEFFCSRSEVSIFSKFSAALIFASFHQGKEGKRRPRRAKVLHKIPNNCQLSIAEAKLIYHALKMQVSSILVTNEDELNTGLCIIPSGLSGFTLKKSIRRADRNKSCLSEASSFVPGLKFRFLVNPVQP